MVDSLALGVGGLEFYKKAFIDLDEAALQSDQMKEVFNRWQFYALLLMIIFLGGLEPRNRDGD